MSRTCKPGIKQHLTEKIDLLNYKSKGERFKQCANVDINNSKRFD